MAAGPSPPSEGETGPHTCLRPLLCHTCARPSTCSCSPTTSHCSLTCPRFPTCSWPPFRARPLRRPPYPPIPVHRPPLLHGPRLTTALASVQSGPPIAVRHPDLLQGVLGQFPWGRHTRDVLSRTARLSTQQPGHLGPLEAPPLGPAPPRAAETLVRLPAGPAPERVGPTPTEEGPASDHACPTRLPAGFGPRRPALHAGIEDAHAQLPTGSRPG